VADDDVFSNTAGEDSRVFVAVCATHDIADLVCGLTRCSIGVGGEVVSLLEGLATDLAYWVLGIE
jgi:hypothetical protein